MNNAYIVAGFRSAVGKAGRGGFRFTRPDDLAADVIKHLLASVPSLDPERVDDLIVGNAVPEAEQGLNVARIASLRAGLPIEASAVTVNRFCSSGLQAIAYAAEHINECALVVVEDAIPDFGVEYESLEAGTGAGKEWAGVTLLRGQI